MITSSAHSFKIDYYWLIKQILSLVMSVEWDTNFIDPKNLIEISRGDPKRMLKYLLQFQELMPERIENLKLELLFNNRGKIRQILHSMSPQLQFFGIPEIIIPIQRLELEYETMPTKELESIVENVLLKLEKALQEINLIIHQNFE
ncbi:MAG: hypothetical protein BalsKO_07480 [Balneolaceae bacterium]